MKYRMTVYDKEGKVYTSVVLRPSIGTLGQYYTFRELVENETIRTICPKMMRVFTPISDEGYDEVEESFVLMPKED